MTATYVLNTALGVLPVLVFLAALVHFDSFKLVKAQSVLQVIAAGAVAAAASYYANGFFLERMPLSFEYYSHFVAPLVEEGLKAAIIMALIWTNRVGFVFDAVILGFAVGAGFAVVENFYYLKVIGAHHPAVWMIRGFGTAIMHGGATAVFAAIGHLMALKSVKLNPLFYVPGFIFAISLHAGFNFFLDFPVSSTIAMFALLAASLAVILRQDRITIHDWIVTDFDRHRTLLQQIRSGAFADDSLGRLFNALHDRFESEIVAKVMAYVELHTELVLAAEEVLLAHERGERALVSPDIRTKLMLLHAAEKDVGKAPLMVLRRRLRFSRHEFWELYMLEKEAGFAHPHVHGV